MSRKNLLIFSIAFLTLFLDQFSKFLIRKTLEPNQSAPVVNNILHFTHITNTGSAFGILKGNNLIFIVFSIIAVIVISYFLSKIKENETLLQLSVGLLFGGVFGNLIDRVFYNAVTDFIDFGIWPVFNIADSAVTISTILLMILLWKR